MAILTAAAQPSGWREGVYTFMAFGVVVLFIGVFGGMVLLLRRSSRQCFDAKKTISRTG